MNEKKANHTGVRRLFIRVSIAAFIFVAACATLQTEQDVKDGRVALMTGRPDDAVKYFSRAAESNPNYKTTYVLRESVWTYLGRAYYETGKYPEARATLDKALASDNKDYVARLYLGMTLVRSNYPDRGRAEMENALNGIYQWLENLSSESPDGKYWDTNKQIRKGIESGLAEKPAAIELVVTAQRVGKQLEEEIARAKWDNVQSSYNQESNN